MNFNQNVQKYVLISCCSILIWSTWWFWIWNQFLVWFTYEIYVDITCSSHIYSLNSIQLEYEPNLATNSWNFLFAKKLERNRKFNCGALNQKRTVRALSENCVFHGMHSKTPRLFTRKVITWKLLHKFMLSIDLIISKWINWTNENQASSILSPIKMNILFQSFYRRTIRAPHVYFCAQKIMLSHLIGCRESVDARYQYIDTVGMDKNVGTCVSYAKKFHTANKYMIHDDLQLKLGVWIFRKWVPQTNEPLCE